MLLNSKIMRPTVRAGCMLVQALTNDAPQSLLAEVRQVSPSADKSVTGWQSCVRFVERIGVHEDGSMRDADLQHSCSPVVLRVQRTVGVPSHFGPVLQVPLMLC